jgi:hypothetical protein
VKTQLAFALERLFPNLPFSGYRVTSLKDKKYNCVAWAATEDTHRWWEPRNGPGIYWPPTVPFNYLVESYVQMFEHIGFERCATAHLEPGFEKVAVFCDKDGDFTHVCRQLASGAWTSKLGKEEDIEHPALESIVSDDYGRPHSFLKRRTMN